MEQKKQNRREHEKRKLTDLNLLDDFLFWAVVNYPEIGVRFVRELLQTIFHRDFGELKITAQKVYYGRDTDRHGARLDVYLEEKDIQALAGTGSIFDVEPDQKDDEQSIAELPRRVRFYHAVIDTESLRSGQGYRALKNVLVIVITPFDPFGRDRMQYTISNRCLEEPDLPYDDGMQTIFLNTKGTRDIPSPELAQLLHYMEETTPENAVSSRLKSIQQMVDTVKQDKEVSLSYMKSWELEEMWFNRGREKERENTEKERANAQKERANAQKERQRAENAEAAARKAQQLTDDARKEILQLREELARLKEK